MSNMASGILGAVAATLALGAVHLEVASGNDLLGPARRGDASLMAPAATQAIDRTAKGDRGAVAPVSPDGVTLSFRLPGIADQSVVMRVPTGAAVEALRKTPAPAGLSGNGAPRRQAIACEPVVSTLTAVAKQLEPGRCIT
jgi:hypothetical protein